MASISPLFPQKQGWALPLFPVVNRQFRKVQAVRRPNPQPWSGWRHPNMRKCEPCHDWEWRNRSRHLRHDTSAWGSWCPFPCCGTGFRPIAIARSPLAITWEAAVPKTATEITCYINAIPPQPEDRGLLAGMLNTYNIDIRIYYSVEKIVEPDYRNQDQNGSPYRDSLHWREFFYRALSILFRNIYAN